MSSMKSSYSFCLHAMEGYLGEAGLFLLRSPVEVTGSADFARVILKAQRRIECVDFLKHEESLGMDL